MKKFVVVLLVLMMITLTGCGDNKRLSGKVTFADGKPAPHGMVFLTSGSFQARGEIQSDGSYIVGSTKAKDGIPKGDYQIFITGVDKPAAAGRMGFVSLCDEKYTSAKTSGLKCTVPAPGNKYDIVLDPHPKNYP